MPQREYKFWVYILSNRSHILYIGMTNNLRERVSEHRKGKPGSFTARYKIDRLVYFETYKYVNNAIARSVSGIDSLVKKGCEGGVWI